MYVYLNRLAIDRHTRWVFAYKFSGVSKFIKGSRVVWEMAGKRKWVKEWQAFNPVMSVIKPQIIIASKAIDRYVYILKTFNTFNSVEYICIFFEPMLRRLSFVHLYLSPFDTVVIVVYIVRIHVCWVKMVPCRCSFDEKGPRVEDWRVILKLAMLTYIYRFWPLSAIQDKLPSTSTYKWTAEHRLNHRNEQYIHYLHVDIHIISCILPKWLSHTHLLRSSKLYVVIDCCIYWLFRLHFTQLYCSYAFKRVDKIR